MGKGGKRKYHGEPCAVEGCDRTAKVRGLCGKHYAKAYAAGEIEVRRPIDKSPHPCPVCGKPAKWHAVACSQQCGRIMSSEKSRKSRQRTCEQCGTVFTKRLPSGRGLKGEVQEGRFCSNECRFTWRREHSNRIGRYRIGACSQIYIQPCVTCERLFLSRQPNARYCSGPCRSQAYGTDPRAKTRRWQTSYERVNKVQVFIRDGWRCQLCGKKLKAKHMGTKRPDAPELDHIIPFAAGGEHSYRNTQCACHKCNQAKGKRPLGQLRLFG